MQVRQVPLRHKRGQAMCASLAAASTVVSALFSNFKPLGVSATV